MTPITPVPPMSSPRKHVAVPDLSDDDDPWAHPLPAPQAPDAVPDGGVSQASPALRQTSQPAAASQPAAGHERHFLAGAASDATADDPWPAVPAAGGFDAHAAETAGPGEPSGPQVDPDEDEYSLSDESLGTAAALSVEELSKRRPEEPEERPTAQARHGVICRIAGEPITGTNWYAAHPHIRRSNCSPPHIPRLRGH